MARRSRIVAGAIAAILLAGCSGPGPDIAPTASATQAPTDVVDPLIPVVRSADFQLAYRLDGTTQRSDGVTVPVAPGLQIQTTVATGTLVNSGDIIGKTLIDPAVKAALISRSATNRIDRARLAELETLVGDAVAPDHGTVAIDPAGHVVIASPGIDVVAPLTPLQVLRLSSIAVAAEATVETVVGQRTVPCEATWIVAEAAPSSVSASNGEETASLHCRLDPSVETVASLRAGLRVTSALIVGATVVPNSALRIEPSGYFVTIVENGQTRDVPVDVTYTDGVVRVVTTDLPIGAELVPPAPSS